MKFPARFNDITFYRQNVPCMEACPVHTDSGRYVQLIAEGRFDEAFLVARSPNPFASVCGRVCAAPCEDACRRGAIDEPITIRSLKRFLTEQYGAESAQPNTYRQLVEGHPDPGSSWGWHLSDINSQITAKPATGMRIAVVGSGPAGLACAHDLAFMGYSVTVLEAKEILGGMMRFGVPEYRLPRGVIEKEIGILAEIGVQFQVNHPLTQKNGVEALFQDGFKAVFLAVGAQAGHDLPIPGHELDGVVKAVDYLLNINKGYKIDLGQRVVVIGGGNVALDAARSAIREFYRPMDEIEASAQAAGAKLMLDAARTARRGGAAEVNVFSLESMAELPTARTVQGKEELADALDEGVHLHTSWGPAEIAGAEGRVQSIRMRAVMRVFDENGRFNPQYDETQIRTVECDSVILAIGQKADLTFINDSDGIEVTPQGTIRIDPETLATTRTGVYSGGDVAFGPRIIIEAVANGKRVAQSIHQYLSGTGSVSAPKVTIETIPAREYKMPAVYERILRGKPPVTATGRRTGIGEVESSYSEEDAVEQAERCLQCHIDTIYDGDLCILCGRCVDVCPEDCLMFVPVADLDVPEEQVEILQAAAEVPQGTPVSALIKDDTACIRCGLCALRCPTEAITMERFSFAEMGGA